MSEQTYEVNLRNFQGGILNTFRGTPEQILAQMEERLDLANYAIWSPVIKGMFRGQKVDPGFMQVNLLDI